MAVAAYRFNETVEAGPTRTYSDFLQGAKQVTVECLSRQEKLEQLFKGENSPFAQFVKNVGEYRQGFEEKHVTTFILAAPEVKVPVDRKEAEQKALSELQNEFITFANAFALSRIAKHAANAVTEKNKDNLPSLDIRYYEHLNALERGAGDRMHDLALKTAAAFSSLSEAYSKLRATYDEAVSCMRAAKVVDDLIKVNSYLNPNTTARTANGAPISPESQGLLTKLAEQEIPLDQAEHVATLTRAVQYKNSDPKMHELHCKALVTLFSNGTELELHSLYTLLQYAKQLSSKESAQKEEDTEEAERKEASPESHQKLVTDVQDAITTALQAVDRMTRIERIVQARSLSPDELHIRLESLRTSRSESKFEFAAVALALSEKGVKLSENDTSLLQAYRKSLGDDYPPIEKVEQKAEGTAGSK